MSAIAPGMILIAYLCGSISSAILVCRLCGLPDPRTSGSGNPGATNVLRIGGKGAAVAVLIFDVLKGMLPVWGAYELGVSPFWLGLIAIAACLGHIWPVFFGFKGGKGVATAFGAIAPIGWDLTGVMAGTWLLTVLLSGYSSLGAIVSALIAPFYVWWFKPQFTFPVSMLSCLILLRHFQTRIKKKHITVIIQLPTFVLNHLPVILQCIQTPEIPRESDTGYIIRRELILQHIQSRIPISTLHI